MLLLLLLLLLLRLAWLCKAIAGMWSKAPSNIQTAQYIWQKAAACASATGGTGTAAGQWWLAGCFFQDAKLQSAQCILVCRLCTDATVYGPNLPQI